MSTQHTPESPKSPKRHHHVDEKKQLNLDKETEKYIEEAGASNHFQAQYHAEVAEAAINSEVPALQDLKPEVKDLRQKAWKKALCLSLAVLKRYKMKMTIETMKLEYSAIPKSTGYTHGREVDEYFGKLFDVSEDLKNITFEQRASEYAKSFGDVPNNETFSIDSGINSFRKD